MSGSRVWAAIVVVVCMTGALAACAAEGDPAVPAPSSATPTDPAASTTWLAGLRVEADPDTLDDDTQALTDVLGDALVVSPASCLDGLPAEVAASDYVLGAVAPSRAELEDLVTRSGREPLFEVEVQVLCVD